MCDCTRWSFQRKINWFRCQFAQHASLPFSEVLPVQVVDSGVDYAVHALLRLALQSGHSVVVVSRPSDPPQSHLGGNRGEFSRLAVGAGNVALLDRHRRLCQGSAASSRSLAGHAHATHGSVRRIGRASLRGGGWGEPSSCSTARRSRCPTPRRTKRPIPRVAPKLAGVGFPLARIGVLFSLSVGTVLDLGIRRWAGKFQSELAMLRDMIARLDEATCCSPIAISAPTWKSLCCSSKASISWAGSTRNGTSIFVVAGSSAVTITWSDGASPRDPNGCLANNTPPSPRPF